MRALFLHQLTEHEAGARRVDVTSRPAAAAAAAGLVRQRKVELARDLTLEAVVDVDLSKYV